MEVSSPERAPTISAAATCDRAYARGASRLACRRCPLDRTCPWIAVACLVRNCRVATLSTAFALTAFRRLAVLDSAAAAADSWFTAVTRDDAFFLRIISILPSYRRGGHLADRSRRPLMGRLALAAPASMDAPVMAGAFVAAMKLAVRQAPWNTTVVRRSAIGSQIAWNQGTPFQHTGSVHRRRQCSRARAARLSDQSPIGRSNRSD